MGPQPCSQYKTRKRRDRKYEDQVNYFLENDRNGENVLTKIKWVVIYQHRVDATFTYFCFTSAFLMAVTAEGSDTSDSGRLTESLVPQPKLSQGAWLTHPLEPGLRARCHSNSIHCEPPDRGLLLTRTNEPGAIRVKIDENAALISS